MKRIAHRIKKNENGCWVWQGCLTFSGYGKIGGNLFGERKTYVVHRVVMSLINEIPKDLVIDHICRNRACCNPNHLRVVTAKQNALENNGGKGELNSKKTHCIHGHEFNKQNTFLKKRPKGKIQRNCRACRSKKALNAYYKNLQSTV